MAKELSLNILEIAKKVQKLESAGGSSADTAKMSDIATEFNETTNYTAGCFVYYEGKLYQFNAGHAAGAWDPTDVVEANVTDQIVSNKAAIEGLTASDIMISDGVTSVEEAVDGLAKKAEAATDITMTPSNGITILSSRIMKMDTLVIAQLKIQWSTPTMHEYQIIAFNGFNVGGNYAVGVVADADTNTLGTFVLSGNNLYIKLSASGITSDTVLCMTVIGFRM